MNKLLLLSLTLSSLCISFQIQAQSNYYRFEAFSSTYHELVNDTLIDPANFGTGDLWAFELNGESFEFFGKSYVLNGVNKLIMFSNSGHMRIDDDSTLIVLDGLFTFLDSIDQNSRLSYTIDGAGDDRILKVQWKNLKIRSGQAGNFVNFQVWLYKKSGMFEIHYGPSSTNNQSGFTNTTGPNVGLFYARQDFSKMYEKIWVNQTPPNITIDSSKTIAFKGLHGVPQDGAVYRFIPKHIVLSVKDSEDLKNLFTISPNPANEQVQLTFSNIVTDAFTLNINDTSGRVVLRHDVASGKKVVNIPVVQLASGIYFLTIDGSEISHKIVIQH